MSQDYTFVFSCRETAFVPALERLRDTLAPQGYAVGPALTRVEVRGDDFFLTECEVPSGGAKGWKTALRGFGEAPGVNLDFTSEALSFELTVAHFPYRHCAVLMSVPMHDCRRLFREQGIEKLHFTLAQVAQAFGARAAAGAIEFDGDYSLLTPDMLEDLFRAGRTDATRLEEQGVDLIAGHQSLLPAGEVLDAAQPFHPAGYALGYWFLQLESTVRIFGL